MQAKLSATHFEIVVRSLFQGHFYTRDTNWLTVIPSVLGKPENRSSASGLENSNREFVVCLPNYSSQDSSEATAVETGVKIDICWQVWLTLNYSVMWPMEGSSNKLLSFELQSAWIMI